MGILVPLYLAGLTALSLPLIFHLVRRTPRSRQEFSSLMFLSPMPPRLTRRSRLTLSTPSTTRIIARFDNGDPALLERFVGQGRVLALTSGWHPDGSQLALSSKFVPLVGALLDLACGGTEVAESVTIGQPVMLATSIFRRSRTRESSDRSLTTSATTVADAPEVIVVQTPDGREIRLDAGLSTFIETDQPGIYLAKVGSTEQRFAVNLAASESNTAPLNLEQLEQRGVRFGTDLTRAERIDRVRQQRDTELESRQKVWRWLIVVALATLILETWWAGRVERKVSGEGVKT